VPVRDRAIEVLATSEARRTLSQMSREFVKRGAAADPVFFGAHRKPAGVMLSYDRYLQLLDRVDDLAIALEIRERDRVDDGTRLSLDELFSEHGFDRAALEAEIEAEDGASKE
jgi:antitoxin StbD